MQRPDALKPLSSICSENDQDFEVLSEVTPSGIRLNEHISQISVSLPTPSSTSSIEIVHAGTSSHKDTKEHNSPCRRPTGLRERVPAPNTVEPSWQSELTAPENTNRSKRNINIKFKQAGKTISNTVKTLCCCFWHRNNKRNLQKEYASEESKTRQYWPSKMP